MRYVRDLPITSTDAELDAEQAHVRDHLAAVADADDDPATRRDSVRVWREHHPEIPALLRIVGELDAEPDAPYLKPDFDPWAGVDPELRRAVLGGQD